MSDIPPPEQPGWYADAHGAWWWWDGAGWTPAPTGGPGGPTTSAAPRGRAQERSQALLMWILYLVVGGWIVALIFYLISKEKPFTRHHAAEALNLTLVLLIPQIVGIALMAPGYLDLIDSTISGSDTSFSLPGTFLAGLALLAVVSLVNIVLAVMAAVKAQRGEWWRLPIGIHPVGGVLRKGAEPPYEVTGA